MSYMEKISVVLGPPATQEDKDKLEAFAEDSGLTHEEAGIKQIENRHKQLVDRSNGPSEVDVIFTEILGEAVTVDECEATFFEKKGKRYPALVFLTAGIKNTSGESMIDKIVHQVDHEELEATLSEKLGRKLEIESAHAYVTYTSI